MPRNVPITPEKEQEIIAALEKDSQRVAGGAHARRCKLRDGVAGGGPQRYCIEGGPRNHGPATPTGGSMGENREGSDGEPECDAEGAGAKNRSEPFDGGPRDACASRRRALS